MPMRMPMQATLTVLRKPLPLPTVMQPRKLLLMAKATMLPMQLPTQRKKLRRCRCRRALLSRVSAPHVVLRSRRCY